MYSIFKYIVSALIIIFFISCSNDEQENFLFEIEFNEMVNKYIDSNKQSCIEADDIILYPDPWTKEAADTFIISEEKLAATSICGLIQTYFHQPWNILGPWCDICSDSSIDGVELFNAGINRNEVVDELFSRNESVRKLVATYIDLILNLKFYETHPGRLHSFEMLLASNALLNHHTINEISDDLLLTSLKMLEKKKVSIEFNNQNSFAVTRHIMVNILMQKNYEPFTKEVLKNDSLETFLRGYSICYEDNKVENYSHMYLKNKFN